MNRRSTVKRQKLVYVMGAGQSGSTILGITLGNCDGFFYGGELEEWLMSAARPRWGASDRQDFWSAVEDCVEDSDGLLGGSANRCLERSSTILRPDRWRERRRLRPAYRRVAQELVTAIADAAQARYVVDTSHFPLRARELRQLPGIELYLIYLVRDPRAVVASNTRELSPHEVAETRWRRLTMNVNLWITQLLSLPTFLSHPKERRMFVRHEDFLDDPGAVTRKILDLLGSQSELPDFRDLTVGAPLQGNRLIRAESVALRSGGAPSDPHDPTTRLLQRIWEPALARLTPAASDRSLR